MGKLWGRNMYDGEIMSKLAQYNNYFSYDYKKSNDTHMSRYILSN